MTDDDIIERIGLNITIIRERRGLTQEKLAELAGLHRAYIGQIERGEKNIGLKNLEKIVQAMGNKIDIIYVTGTDFGYQRGPLMSPDVFNDLYKPHYKRICDYIHASTTWKTFIHT